MPAKNSIKTYLPDSYYHIYNRGVEKRNIFLDTQDYSVFVSYLKTYLLPKDLISLERILQSSESLPREKDLALRLMHMNNFSDEIELCAYCLMPNHFHLLLHQKSLNGIDRFVNSLGSRYSRYFNSKYKRVGKLFQGVYKAVLVESDEQLIHLSRYIHLNPFGGSTPIPTPEKGANRNRDFSSLSDYLGIRESKWLRSEKVMEIFRRFERGGDYFSFVNRSQDSELIYDQFIDYGS